MPGNVTPRRFPPPWSLEDKNDPCLIVHYRRKCYSYNRSGRARQ